MRGEQIGSMFTEEMWTEWRQRGGWTYKDTYSTYMKRWVEKFPDKDALIDPTKRMTWRQVEEAVDRLALNFIELGLKKDDIVGCGLPNSVNHVLSFHALQRIGAIAIPIALSHRHEAVEYMLSFTEAPAHIIPAEYGGFDYPKMIDELRPKLPKLKYVIVDADKVPEGAVSYRELLEKEPKEKYPPDYLDQFDMDAIQDLVMIMPTSGTTGLPKLINYPHIKFLEAEYHVAESGNIRSDDVLLAVSPMHTKTPLACSLGLNAITGCTLVMLPEFEVETVLKTCVQEKVTAFGGVPTNMIDVMRSPLLSKYDISRIHAFINAGAPLPADVARQMLKMGIFPQGLAGTTEFCGSGGLRPTDPEDKVLYTVGRRLVGSDVATFGLGDPNKRLPFGEEGELGVKTLWFGYFREKEKSQEQLNKLGFFMTGDVCVIDEDGYLRYSGMRKEDMIIRGDQAIKPRDVEELLFTSPKIADAAIVGMPDPELGQRVCAYVVPKAGESITLDEVKSFLKGKVEEHKLPERLEIVGAIPRSAGAKVDKKTMRDDVAEKLKKEGKI